MENIINSNCRKCPGFVNGDCEGNDPHCMCKFCPRNFEVCLQVKWCRESETSIIIEEK